MEEEKTEIQKILVPLKLAPRRRNGRIDPGLRSLSHGFRATDPVLMKSLNRRERMLFLGFKSDLQKELQPETVIEEMLIERVALSQIRMRRLAEVDYVTFRRAIYTDCVDNDLTVSDLRVRQMQRLADYEGQIERTFRFSLHELQRIQARRAGANVPPPAMVDMG